MWSFAAKGMCFLKRLLKMSAFCAVRDLQREIICRAMPSSGQKKHYVLKTLVITWVFEVELEALRAIKAGLESKKLNIHLTFFDPVVQFALNKTLKRMLILLVKCFFCRLGLITFPVNLRCAQTVQSIFIYLFILFP